MKINIKNIRVRSICATLFISLFLSCNNGIEDLQKEKDFLSSLANLGKGFLDVFVSFGDMVTDTLDIKADTKKEDIGKYFINIEKTMISVKEKLQAEVAKNGYEKVKAVVDKFIIDVLDKIAEGSKKAAIGVGDAGVISNASESSGQEAEPAQAESVNALVKGIKTMVSVVLKDGEGSAEATKTTQNENKEIGKLFGQKSAATETVAAASASVGAVSGADILRAIAKSGDVSGTPVITSAQDAASIAVAQKQNTQTLNVAKKYAVIAAGIALRVMAKGGQFAANNDKKVVHAVNGAAASAVSKTLSTLIIAIRNTVDSGLKKINDALATVTQEDHSVAVIKTAEATSSTQQ
ncbi:variable large family protein (plasmid) [Borrelia coriaceae]|uniref:Variable large protein n=1 Tax=Borrelia coriaceae ATCC 43381 TaxID=1408429 RepID=W5SWF9_9SPIR|nr:variable large family protein [Borrelia coriaceae]AHH11265.1 Variable outer membrane protein [Borrelia coriaceae ATCC 43381]UPA17430.1 variable large family protein [Borrelia coriaceae]